MNWQKLCAIAALRESEMHPCDAGDVPLIAVLRGGEVYVYEDRCPHVDYPLSVGYVEGDEIVCTWHGACFAIENGEVRCPPADGPLVRIPSKVESGDVYVDARVLSGSVSE